MGPPPSLEDTLNDFMAVVSPSVAAFFELTPLMARATLDAEAEWWKERWVPGASRAQVQPDTRGSPRDLSHRWPLAVSLQHKYNPIRAVAPGTYHTAGCELAAQIAARSRPD